jgi:hypothetical protein
MKHIKLFLIAFIFGSTLISCSWSQDNGLSDPTEFAKQFPAVCKVGLRGGDGTLIDNKWVLTAGHVAEGMYKRTNGKLSVYFDNGKEYAVKNVFIHPKFKPMGPYDIALLQLESEVKDIVPHKIFLQSNELNQPIIIAGHGDKKQADGSWIKDGQLRAYTNIIDKVSDTHIIFDYDAPENNPTEREGTSGPGDSGGPAFIKMNNDYFVAGISSMGEPGINGPASYGAIEHFVRVSKYQDWIMATIKNPDVTNAYKIQEHATLSTSGNAVLSDSEQSKRAMLIVKTLGNYSDEKMEEVISKTYDESVLSKRDPKQIIKNMPFLIKELQNSTLEKIRSQSATKISVQLKKEKTDYVLDIFFLETTGKIEQMAFGRLN